MDSQAESDRIFFEHQCAEIRRLWQSLLLSDVGYDHPSFLSQLSHDIDALAHDLEAHFTDRYTTNGFEYTSPDLKFREYHNALHHVREDVAKLKAPIARRQIADIATKLMDAQDALKAFEGTHRQVAGLAVSDAPTGTNKTLFARKVTMPELPKGFYDTLFGILIHIDALNAESSRNMLLHNLPKIPATTLKRSTSKWDDLHIILQAASSWGRVAPTNQWALVIVTQNALAMTADTSPGRALEQLLATVEPEPTKAAQWDKTDDIADDVLQQGLDRSHTGKSIKQAVKVSDKTMIPHLRGKIDFGIITIREDEFRAVLRRFPTEKIVRARRHYNLNRVLLEDSDYYLAAVVRCGTQGVSEAQSVARDLIEDLDPQWLVLVGIAGGVPEYEFSLGDVVAAMSLNDFCVQADLEGVPAQYATSGGPMHPEIRILLANLDAMEPQLRGWNTEQSIGMAKPPVSFSVRNFYGDEDWQRKVKNTLRAHYGSSSTPRSPLVTTAAIAASDRLVKDSELIKQWQQAARHIKAVEMELAGVYIAARQVTKEYPILALRGISDIVGFKRHPYWTSYACHSAAAFAQALIRTRPIEPRSREFSQAEHKQIDHWLSASSKTMS